MFGFSVDKEIRLQEQLKELIDLYGLDAVKNSLAQIPNQPAPQPKQVEPKPQAGGLTAVKNSANYQSEIEKEKAEAAAKPKLPPNVKTLDEFVRSASTFRRDKVREYVLQKLKYFVDNARLVEAGEFKKIDSSFAMGLTEKDFFGDIVTPEEDWLEYNANIIKKQIKKKLRPYGYDFLDLEFEVGKVFDPNRHNCVGTEGTDSKFKDGRVTKVVNEGLIIDRVLHINANVIVGKYKPGS
jgi:hypothetical protein